MSLEKGQTIFLFSSQRRGPKARGVTSNRKNEKFWNLRWGVGKQPPICRGAEPPSEVDFYDHKKFSNLRWGVFLMSGHIFAQNALHVYITLYSLLRLRKLSNLRWGVFLMSGQVFAQNALHLYSHSQWLFYKTKQVLSKPASRKMFSAAIGKLSKTEQVAATSWDRHVSKFYRKEVFSISRQLSH